MWLFERTMADGYVYVLEAEIAHFRAVAALVARS